MASAGLRASAGQVDGHHGRRLGPSPADAAVRLALSASILQVELVADNRRGCRGRSSQRPSKLRRDDRRDAVSIVSLVMKCAIRAKARNDDPAAGHEVKVPRRKVRAGDVPDMAELECLVAQVRDPYKPAVWLMAYTGLRPSELCGRRARSIDLPDAWCASRRR